MNFAIFEVKTLHEMRKLAFLPLFLTFLLVTQFTYAQKKIKYKDIWGLLNTKQYEAAEPFLKTYLNENNDNPNAFLFMGIIFQEKAGKDDVLKHTGLAIAHMDSAITFFTKAYQTITEKEVKKNNEYYQSYNRRDLRTGEFGVKLSDIQFDLEKRMEGLRERTDRVKMVKHYFSLADTLYKRCNILYTEIQNKYSKEKELYLRADENSVRDLATLSNRYDSCMKAFEQYKGSVTMLGKIGYTHALTRNEIKVFKSDGLSPSDFFQNEVVVWDYKAWAQQAKQAIEKEIFPIREHLVSYDIEINKLREKLTKDSASVKNDLTKLIDRLLLEKLSKYDEKPLPMDVFAVKIADLEYRSILLDNKKLRDSSDVHLQLSLARKELDHVNKLDSITAEVLKHDFDKELENYKHFVTNTYGNATVLKSFLKVMKDFSSREKEIRSMRLTKAEKALQWMVLNEKDSIPLFTPDVAYRFMPVTVVEEKFTVGLEYTDSLTAQGYFYSITPSRKPDIKITFPVDKPAFKRSQFRNTRTLAYSDAAGQVFYVLLFTEKPGKDNKYQATLAKIYRSDGLAWSHNYTLPFIPKELSYRTDSGEFIIKADATESIVDKNGKMLR
jgi:hypothetical protein